MSTELTGVSISLLTFGKDDENGSCGRFQERLRWEGATNISANMLEA